MKIPSMKIVPTVGRILYYSPGVGDAVPHDGKVPIPAIIVRVWSDSLLNLTVFDHNGNSHARTSVPLVQEGGDVPVSPSCAYCYWMPYQIQQAVFAAYDAATPAPEGAEDPS